jgi:hypothetical protein
MMQSRRHYLIVSGMIEVYDGQIVAAAHLNRPCFGVGQASFKNTDLVVVDVAIWHRT